MESQNKSRNSAIISLPKEIIEGEILPRLPVKSLLRLRCVSQSWRALIGSEGFIKTQFQNSTRNTSSAHHRVIFRSSLVGLGLRQCSVYTLLNEPSNALSSPSDDPTINESYVVGCCNGLLCIRHQKQGRFLLWNPATRISFELPKIERAKRTCGFGYDAASGAYKVFAAVPNHNGLAGMVYSSKTNSWRNTVSPLRKYYGIGMFVCGRIHWLNRRRSIDSFDLKIEVFGVMEHPRALESGKNQWLGEIKGCLSLVCDNSKTRELGVWIMKESWLKVLKVPFDLCPFPAQFEIVSQGMVLLIYDLAFIALNRDHTLLSSPIKVKAYSKIYRDIYREGYKVTHFYVQSLVSPVPDAALLTV